MIRFITRDKMSKKARRQLDRQSRRFWQICPATRVEAGKKQYNRKKNPAVSMMDGDAGIFILHRAIPVTSIMGYARSSKLVFIAQYP